MTFIILDQSSMRTRSISYSRLGNLIGSYFTIKVGYSRLTITKNVIGWVGRQQSHTCIFSACLHVVRFYVRLYG